MAPHAETTDFPQATPEETTHKSTKVDTASYSSLPVPDPCLSYWHRTTRAWPHLNHNDSTPVPTSTKYLILGSGLAGSLTAWSLLEKGIPANDVVILEAREAVSGASGRNAGHVRPDAFRGDGGHEKLAIPA